MTLPLVAALSLGCAGGQGARPTGISPGQQVRLTIRDSVEHRLSGTIVGVREGDFTVEPDSGEPLQVPLDAVTALAIKVGRKRNAGRGALIGLGVGLVGFVAIDAAEGGCSSDEPLCDAGRAVGFVVLSGGGLLLGTLVGLAVETDQWQELSLPLSLGMRQRDGGITLGWSVALSRHKVRQ